MSRKEGTGIGFVGLGVHLPDEVRTNDFWGEEWLETHAARLRRDIGGSVDKAVEERRADVDPEVARHAPRYAVDVFRGTRERRVMAPNQRPSDMEIAACRAALAHAGVAPSEVDALLVQSTVSDHATLANTGRVATGLGLRGDILAFNLDSACSSFALQTIVGTRLIQSGAVDTVLVAASCAASWITDYSAPSSPLTGDGAAAAVLRRVAPGDGLIGHATMWKGEQHEALLLIPKDQPDVRWVRTDTYAQPLTVQPVDHVALHVAGAYAASMAREACHAVLLEAGHAPEDVDWFLVANATAWFPDALAEAVGVPAGRWLEPSRHFQRFGHLLSGSLALNMYLSHQHDRLSKGDLVLMYTPGVGFNQAALLYRWNLERPVPVL